MYPYTQKHNTVTLKRFIVKINFTSTLSIKVNLIICNYMNQWFLSNWSVLYSTHLFFRVQFLILT